MIQDTESLPMPAAGDNQLPPRFTPEEEGYIKLIQDNEAQHRVIDGALSRGEITAEQAAKQREALKGSEVIAEKQLADATIQRYSLLAKAAAEPTAEVSTELAAAAADRVLAASPPASERDNVPTNA